MKNTVADSILPPEILKTIIVKVTMIAIRCMWDVRGDKTFYYRCNWLEGMDEEYSEVLRFLWSNYSNGYESQIQFAYRLAGLKNNKGQRAHQESMKSKKIIDLL